MSQYNTPISGGIFFKSDAVTSISTDKIADYEGAAAVNIAIESSQAFGQNFWPQEYSLNQMDLSLNYGGVYWKNSHVNILLGITATQAAMKSAGTETATLYELTTSMTTIPTGEFLSEVTRSSDSKLFHVWCAAGRLASDFNLALTKSEFMTTELGIGCYADANGKVVSFYQEQ